MQKKVFTNFLRENRKKMFSLRNMFKGTAGFGNASGIGNANYKGVQAPVTAGGFPDILTKTNLWATTGADITLSASSFVRIGEYEIPAQSTIYLGTGVSGGNPEEIGHLHLDLVDDTATNSARESGSIQIGYTNHNETIRCVVWRGRSETLSDTSTSVGISRSDEILLPETSPMAKGYPPVLAQEKSKLFVEMKADAADILVETGIGTGAINVWSLPITSYY